MEVFDPSGEVRPAGHAPPRLSTLEGKTVCVLSNGIWEAERVLSLFEEMLQQRVPGVKIVHASELPYLTDIDRGTANVSILKDQGCDAVILGNGG